MVTKCLSAFLQKDIQYLIDYEAVVKNVLKTKKEAPFLVPLGAENETRTRDPDLGKVVLYQLSYFRVLALGIQR